MKTFTLYFFPMLLLLCAASVSAAPRKDENALIKKQCDVPPKVAYCFDMLRLGSNHDSKSSAESKELQEDMDQVPIGMCSWGDWAGKISADECMKALEEFKGGNDDDDNEDEVATTDGDDGANNTVRPYIWVRRIRVSRIIYKVNKFCRPWRQVCRYRVRIAIRWILVRVRV